VGSHSFWFVLAHRIGLRINRVPDREGFGSRSRFHFVALRKMRPLTEHPHRFDEFRVELAFDTNPEAPVSYQQRRCPGPMRWRGEAALDTEHGVFAPIAIS